ncbi:site-specific DNA-methyltransferase [Brevibacillus gelatini]|uniref:Site-specific DNA-methyltransferase n=2 Tax=Brevibacillus gelatini TaxID=1655277 RepID=A0A3M8B8A0_9BACL|nr:site-specific DNA-methyltransferase [Brevibacillus gelatini]
MLLKGDCLEIMPRIPDKSIDMVLCDLPYGMTTRNKWDEIIPFDKLWDQYNRIVKENGVLVFTGRQPFTSMLITSNKKDFKYTMVWRKNLKSGNLNAKKRPMVAFEDVVIFYKEQPTYNPQAIPRTFQTKCGKKSGKQYDKHTSNYGKQKLEYTSESKDWLMPDDVLDYEDNFYIVEEVDELENKMLYFEAVHNSTRRYHPTQKPVELFEWLVKTFTNEGDIVLDNTSGSGTTAVACEKANRKWICIEKDDDGKGNSLGYCDATVERIKNIYNKLMTE